LFRLGCRAARSRRFFPRTGGRFGGALRHLALRGCGLPGCRLCRLRRHRVLLARTHDRRIADAVAQRVAFVWRELHDAERNDAQRGGNRERHPRAMPRTMRRLRRARPALHRAVRRRANGVVDRRRRRFAHVRAPRRVDVRVVQVVLVGHAEPSCQSASSLRSFASA
jgi:hypothetical protein